MKFKIEEKFLITFFIFSQFYIVYPFSREINQNFLSINNHEIQPFNFQFSNRKDTTIDLKNELLNNNESKEITSQIEFISWKKSLIRFDSHFNRVSNRFDPNNKNYLIGLDSTAFWSFLISALISIGMVFLIVLKYWFNDSDYKSDKDQSKITLLPFLYSGLGLLFFFIGITMTTIFLGKGMIDNYDNFNEIDHFGKINIRLMNNLIILVDNIEFPNPNLPYNFSNLLLESDQIADKSSKFSKNYIKKEYNYLFLVTLILISTIIIIFLTMYSFKLLKNRLILIMGFISLFMASVSLSTSGRLFAYSVELTDICEEFEDIYLDKIMKNNQGILSKINCFSTEKELFLLDLTHNYNSINDKVFDEIKANIKENKLNDKYKIKSIFDALELISEGLLQDNKKLNSLATDLKNINKILEILKDLQNCIHLKEISNYSLENMCERGIYNYYYSHFGIN